MPDFAKGFDLLQAFTATAWGFAAAIAVVVELCMIQVALIRKAQTPITMTVAVALILLARTAGDAFAKDNPVFLAVNVALFGAVLAVEIFGNVPRHLRASRDG